jgi:hypothetical protein
MQGRDLISVAPKNAGRGRNAGSIILLKKKK